MNIVPMRQVQQHPYGCDCGCGGGGFDFCEFQKCWDQISQMREFMRQMMQEVGIPGVCDGSEAARGMVGEFIEIDGTNTINSTTETGAYTNVATLNLSAGDWMIYANMYAGPMTADQFWVFLGPSSIPLAQTDPAVPSDGVAWLGERNLSNDQVGGSIGPIRVLSNQSSGINLRANATSATASTVSISWAVAARRVR